MSEAQPDYGLPVLSDVLHGSGDHVSVVERAIRTTIEKYEPRLRRVRITRAVEEGATEPWLAFRVDALLVASDGEHKVWYQTNLTSTGCFEVTD